MQSPQILVDAIANLAQPDPELHETRIDIEPYTGLPIRLHKKIQVNFLKTGILGKMFSKTLLIFCFLVQFAC